MHMAFKLADKKHLGQLVHHGMALQVDQLQWVVPCKHNETCWL